MKRPQKYQIYPKNKYFINNSKNEGNGNIKYIYLFLLFYIIVFVLF